MKLTLLVAEKLPVEPEALIEPAVVALKVTLPEPPVEVRSEPAARLSVRAELAPLLWTATSPLVAVMMMLLLSVGVERETPEPVMVALAVMESAAAVPEVRATVPVALMLPLVTMFAEPQAETLPVLVTAPSVMLPAEVVMLNGLPLPVMVPLI